MKWTAAVAEARSNLGFEHKMVPVGGKTPDGQALFAEARRYILEWSCKFRFQCNVFLFTLPTFYRFHPPEDEFSIHPMNVYGN